jgi:hypothetical protein
MWPSATIFSILLCDADVDLRGVGWRHDYPRILFALAEFDASAVFTGDAAAKNPDGPEQTVATW